MKKIGQGSYTFETELIIDSYIKYFDEYGLLDDLSPEDLVYDADYLLSTHFHALIEAMDRRIMTLHGYKKDRLCFPIFFYEAS
jgi:hypothetical protein